MTLQELLTNEGFTCTAIPFGIECSSKHTFEKLIEVFLKYIGLIYEYMDETKNIVVLSGEDVALDITLIRTKIIKKSCQTHIFIPSWKPSAKDIVHAFEYYKTCNDVEIEIDEIDDEEF